MAAKLVKEGLCWCLQFSRARRSWKLCEVQAVHCFEPHPPRDSTHLGMKLELEVENTTLLAIAGVTVLIAVLIGVGILQSASTTPYSEEPNPSSRYQSQVIEVDKYDEGDRVVLARTVEPEVLSRGERGLKIFRGYVGYTGGEWVIFFQTQSTGWIFDDTPKAYFLADGSEITIKLRSIQEARTDNGDLRHDFIARMDNDRLRREMAKASRVRMRIGDWIFDITDMVDDEIEAIASRLGR